MKLLLLLASVSALCGCNSVNYSRTSDGTEKFTARGFFMNVAAQQLSVGGRTGTNLHGLTVKGVNGTGDAATIQAIIDGAIQGAVKAAATTVKP